MSWKALPLLLCYADARQWYRQLAELGNKAAREKWGVEEFDEKHRDIHSFAKRVGRLPEQKEGDEVDFRGLLHRDGSVISAVSLQVCVGHVA